MRAVSITVSDLGGLYLGQSGTGTIVLDDNAGGSSWFIDATPGEDGEYSGTGTLLTADDPYSQAGTRIDLLTVVMHELGHQVGLDHETEADELMYGSISAGQRRLPGEDDLDEAADAPVSGSLALTPVSLGTIPGDQTVVIDWTSTVDVYANGLVPSYDNYSTLSGDNFTDVTSNIETLSGTSGLVLDSLTLGGTVWSDDGAGGGTADNGVIDGTEAGTDGVAVSLFVDADNNDLPDTPLTALATTTTAGGGAYSFTGLAPGNYIVQIDGDNFDAGGNVSLVGRGSSVGAPDPDNNVDGDDNGFLSSGAVFSRAITLDFNDEPTADGTGQLDVNTTLDFGFVDINDPPTSTGLDTDSVTWTEGDVLPVLLDLGSNATIADIDSADFAGGTLTVAITGGGVSAEDQLVIRTTGTVSFDATAVYVNGSHIAIYTGGGAGGGPLVFDFHSNATPATVAELLRAIAYHNSGGDDPTDGDRTVTWTLVDGDGTANSGTDTLVVTTTVDVDPINDAPVAQPDAVATDENTVLTGNAGALFVDNGSGADDDVDGPALEISEVNGSAANVGTQFALASGALLTVNADGSYSYDPNGQFVTLTDNTSDAVNTSADDSFTYMLEGGNTVTVTVTVAGVAGPGDWLRGDAGDNTITGTAGIDLFMLHDGGNDTATGGGSNDGFYMGAALDGLDSLDGQGGTFDQLGLQGSYAGYTFSAGNLTNIEMLVLLTGAEARFGDTAGNLYSYDLTTIDANVGAGQELIVSFNTLKTGENVTFDGSAETDGSFLTYGGQGNDELTGGAQNDRFFFGAEGRWGAGDQVSGGGGTMDQLGLQGLYAGATAVSFGAGQISGIEMLVLLSGGDTRYGSGGLPYSYDITMHDGNVAAGQLFYVSANTLRVDETLTFDGSAESDARFTVYGGLAADTIIGSAGADQLWGRGGDDVLTGGLGADVLSGGDGNDQFVYLSAADSTTTAPDLISDFLAGDTIDLSGIDAIAGGGEDAFSFIGAAGFSNTAGELRYASAGGTTVIQGDTDGDGFADFEIELSGTITLQEADFVL